MTSTLAARAASLRSRLEALDETESNVAEVSALEGLRAGLSRQSEKLASELANQKLLSSASIPVQEPESLVAVRKIATRLLARFQKEKKAATLKRGKNWNGLLEASGTATQDLAKAVERSWRNHQQTVFAGETPSKLRIKLARTTPNDEAFETYEKLFLRFKEIFQSLPIDAVEISNAGKIAVQLEEAGKAFDWAVPDEVKLFLDEVLSVSGAPLSLLTPGVQKWLKDNNLVDDYHVRAAVL